MASLAVGKNSEASMAYRNACVADQDKERISKLKKVPYS
ncbi:hypothetical protein KYI92_14345 [Pantoea allii]|uniref:Uncharacterized protein n=1 Tax=Pantoea allii TaxID=574096 RepID=A0ABS6VG17_9GAMM|nr:hypothetical protein [Pantoea allii]MBW1258264.1 hypothetical protein [Pantoea allii]MBW1267485.1 hypothetical protein [Pantoea allii]MBW1289553.1 hypothetical protein [Pantoea allii]